MLLEIRRTEEKSIKINRGKIWSNSEETIKRVSFNQTLPVTENPISPALKPNK